MGELHYLVLAALLVQILVLAVVVVLVVDQAVELLVGRAHTEAAAAQGMVLAVVLSGAAVVAPEMQVQAYQGMLAQAVEQV